MKKFEFKHNDTVVFESFKQRIKFMSIAKNNGYDVSDCDSDTSTDMLQCRFRDTNSNWTIWVIGEPPDHRSYDRVFTPDEFLAAVSQYEKGDEVIILEDSPASALLSKNDICIVKKILDDGIKVDSMSWALYFENVMLYKHVSKEEIILPIGFGVKGSKALLKAFTEETITIGWKADSLFEGNGDSLYFNISEDADLPIGAFWYAILSEDRVSFYLPDQWHEAIEMAKESLPKPKIKFKEGDWVWHENLEEAFYVINRMTSNLMWQPNYVSVEAANENKNIYKRYATKEEAAYFRLELLRTGILIGKHKCYYFHNVWKEITGIERLLEVYFDSIEIAFPLIRIIAGDTPPLVHRTEFSGLKVGCQTFTHDEIVKIAKQLGITT